MAPGLVVKKVVFEALLRRTFSESSNKSWSGLSGIGEAMSEAINGPRLVVDVQEWRLDIMEADLLRETLGLLRRTFGGAWRTWPGDWGVAATMACSPSPASGDALVCFCWKATAVWREGVGKIFSEGPRRKVRGVWLELIG